MRKEFTNIYEMYTELRAKRDENTDIWYDISNFVGIQVDSQYFDNNNTHTGGDAKDVYVDDPTAAIAVVQAGDYTDGIMWGTGEGALTLEPSDWVAERSEPSAIDKYFEYRTSQLLKNMNHSKAGFSTARKAFFYDQVAFGNSGIGAFVNENFVSGNDEHPYIFRNFGVDNTCIDEGQNGMVDIVFVVYRWRVNRIVEEFPNNYDDLPKPIRQHYEQNNLNEEFTLVQGIYPRHNFIRGKKGKIGTRYKSDWFMRESDNSGIFFSEDHRTMPIGMVRAIKIRGEVYGRSPGTMLISTIKSVNYMFTQAMETIEKLNNPALGVWNSAVFGDSVVDTSAGGLVNFNESVASKGNPMFKLFDAGDPTALVSFLIPYLNEKIATGFKTDILLDFASGAEKTATEMMQRYAIRGKSLAGFLNQIKNEGFERWTERCIQIEDDIGLKGIDPTLTPEEADRARENNREDIVIPEVVAQAMKEGRQWYKIKFNNELERMTNTEALERVLQSVQAIQMLIALNPSLAKAVEWYKIFKDVCDYLGVNYIKDEKTFKAIMQAEAETQRQAMLLQAGQVGADIQAKMSKSNKDNADAEK